MQLDRTQRDGLILILLSVFGYSTFPLWVKGLTEAGLPALDMATWRFVFAAPMIALLVLGRGKRTQAAPIRRVPLLFSGMFMAVAALTGIAGVQVMPASLYVMLFYSYPAMIAVMSLLRGERFEAVMWFALGLTLVGVILTIPDLGEGLAEGANAQGVMLALLNAFVVALYFQMTSHFMKGISDTMRASVYSIVGALLPLLAWALLRGLTFPTELSTWLLLIGFAAISTVLPMASLNAGIHKLGPARAAILSTIEPVLTLTWSVLLLNERPQAIQLVGGALIFASVILLQLRRTPVKSPAVSESLGEQVL